MTGIFGFLVFIQKVLPAQVLSLLLFIGCLASFGWGMRAFFAQPSGYTAGMRFTSALGIVCAIVDLTALAVIRGAPVERVWGGDGIYVASLILFWWTVQANRAQRLSAIFSPDLPQHVVTTGPYRYVRHPFYSSYLLAWLAGAVITLHWAPIVVFAVMLVLYTRAAIAEENKFAQSTIASQYSAYRRSAGRFLPRLLRTK